jgi:hypothetical protein
MTRLTILETNILHASDVIYWMDGTSAHGPDAMERLSQPVDIRLAARPAGLQMVNGNGKTAFWLRTDGTIIKGIADETDKAFPPASTYSLIGTVSDPQGRYNPRVFTISAGNADGHRIILYPTPLGTRFGKAGGLVGTLRRTDNEAPVPWAFLSLDLTTSLGAPMIFRAQADHRGDFMLSVKRLPPLPEGLDYYDAELTITAPTAMAPQEPVDPDDPGGFSPVLIGSPESEETYTASLNLQIVFGEIRSIQSLNKDYLSVQPS